MLTSMRPPVLVRRPARPSRAAAFFRGLIFCVLALAGAVSSRANTNYLTPPWALSTHAGYTGAGRADGPAAAASFDGPSAVAVDGAGNVYIADTFNSTIRRLTPAGQVSTYAGTPGVAGVADGSGQAARFNFPGGLAAASDGVLYVADTASHLIRRISATGSVTTLAGTAGQSGSTNATGAAARFRSPAGLALDATAGVLYIADTGNHLIRRLVVSTGAVTTLAGTAVTTGSTVDGAGAAARFHGPIALALSADRTLLYVADFEGQTIRRIVVATGAVTTLAGSATQAGSADGAGSAARFDKPQGLALSPAGHLLVADTNGCRIRQLTTAGVVTTLAGSYLQPGSVDGVGAAARFNQPRGLAYDAVAGRLLVADALNAQIRALDLGTLAVATAAGRAVSQGSGDGAAYDARFRDPWGVARDAAGHLYVADRGNRTLRKITAAGAVSTLAGAAGQSGTTNGLGAQARFNEPVGVAVAADGSVIYVSDFAAGEVRRVTAAGEVTTFAIGFNQPAGLALDGSGNLYVAEFGANTIRRVTPAGVVSLYAGAIGFSGSTNGPRLSARFFSPFGLAADAAGNLFVGDFNNQTVRRIAAADGAVTTLAGAAGQAGSLDATGSSARFFYPAGVAVDSAGVVYVTDYANQLVRRIAADGAVRTFVGTAVTPGGVDGIAGAARLRNPRGIAVNPANGEFFVADAGNHAIRSGTLAPAPRITSANTASGVVGVAFASYVVTATNGALAYGASGLPPGLAINTQTGVISGTPLFAGVYNVTLTAENLGGVGDLAAVFTIAKAAATVELSGLSTPFDGSPKSPVATTTPAGLAVTFTYDGSAITPSAYGAYAVVATIQDANYQGSATAVFSITAPVAWSVSTLTVSGPRAVRGLAVDASGNLYLADSARHVIWRRTPAGVLSVFAGGLDAPGYVNGAAASARFNGPTGLAFDASGNLYVADTQNHSIRRITAGGTVSLLAGGGGEANFDWIDATGAAARFYLPTGLVVAPDGRLYVADSGNSILRRVNLTTAAVEYFATNPATFDQPAGLTVAPDGTLFMTAVAGHQIWRINAGGSAGLLAGSGFSVAGQADGTGSNALFDTPSAIAYGSDGALYVADTANHTLRRVTLAGVVTTVAGTADQPGFANGFGAVARFYEPVALAFAADGSLYVADLGGEALATPAPALRRASPPPIAPVFNPLPNMILTEGLSVFGYVVSATGSPTAYGAQGLPPGLSLNATTGALTGTPTASGIYAVTLSATNSLTTTRLTYELTVGTRSLAAWRAAYFTSPQLADAAISGSGADPDGDGVPNVFEYINGRDPWTRDGALPAALIVNGFITIEFERLRAGSGWVAVPEYSENLGTWQRGAPWLEVASVTIIDSRRERVAIRASANGTVAPRRFLRLVAEPLP